MRRVFEAAKWAVWGLSVLVVAGITVGPFEVAQTVAQEKEKAAVSSEEAKKSFADRKAGKEYRSRLPADQKPPLDYRNKAN